MTIQFPKLEPWQEEIYNHFKDKDKCKGNVYVCKAKRQIGKTLLATILLIEYAVLRKTTSIVLEPVSYQSRRVFKQIAKALEPTGLIKSANASLLTMEFTNGSEILFKSAEQEDGLRGMTCTGLLVIDEGAFIRDDIYDIVFPCVDANNAPTLVISTPLFTDGKFHELYTNPENITFDWSIYDTSKYLSKEKLEYYRKTVSPNKFKSEYLGLFISDGSYVFGNVRQCIKTSSKQPVHAGIDWATGSNGDYTWVTFMDEDNNVTRMEYFKDIAPTEQIQRIATLINSTPTLQKVQVELNSIGSVYYDMLKNMVKSGLVIGFNTTNESKRRIVEQLVSAFQQDKIGIPNDTELISQLQHYAVEKTTKGYTYNAVSGFHDDGCISLALSYDLGTNSNGNYTVAVHHRAKSKPSLREKYK